MTVLLLEDDDAMAVPRAPGRERQGVGFTRPGAGYYLAMPFRFRLGLLV